MGEANSVYKNAADFVGHLGKLRKARLDGKTKLDASEGKRRSLTAVERNVVLEKTGGRCHICGGEILGKWTADHVLAHVNGGVHSIANYLPAHAICNGARWFYGVEEFQWIMKLGVFFRTQLEEESNPDAVALAEAFVAHQNYSHSRRKSPGLRG